MNEHLYYLIIDIACITFPLLFSFHPSIKFYKEWKPLFKALFITGILFILCDEWFTVMDVWSFNSKYITGLYIGYLPIEEMLFFLFIPYCLMFMYHCSARYFENNKPDDILIKIGSLLLSSILIIVGIIYYNKWYTGFTFIVTGLLIGVICLSSFSKHINWLKFWLIYAVGLIPFFIVNGLLTSIPIVQYNNSENLSVRITTIPVEDFVYNLLLFLCNVILYETFRKNKKVNML